MTVTSSPAWQALYHHAQKLETKAPDIADLSRLAKFSRALEGLRLTYAFQTITDETLPLLMDLARQQKVEEWRDKMFKGEKINTTEARAVLHTALRDKGSTPILVAAQDVRPQIDETRQRLLSFVEDVRSGKIKGATGKAFRYVVNIGIGGSDLGPRLVAEALREPEPSKEKLTVRFVANVDAFELEAALTGLPADETLFVVVSKTFTTPETLLNAQSARKWLASKLGDAAVKDHFVAVSVNKPAVISFGIAPARTFPMWDWVGGRYSVWSAVGLSVALAIGRQAFEAFLSGAASMDAHFLSAPLETNMPVLMALLGVWNRNFLNLSSLAVLPYAERLRNLPRFLQQLDMESNGKSVTRDGVRVDYPTGPIIFGECGTVGQHSFHQWLHQGSDRIAADFVGVIHDDLEKQDHHHVLMLNLAAQIGALAFGRKDATQPHEIYEGARPSNLLLLDTLSPFNVGMLLALYEHKVFVQGIVWEINSFDQPGVELGKQMAKMLESSTARPHPASKTITALLESMKS